MRFASLAVLAAALLIPTAAHADEATSTWYGYQTLLVDAAVIGVGVASSGSEAASVPVGVGYLAGGPIVHLAHGRGGAAGGSLALRVTLPLLGILVGGAIGSAAVKDCTGDWCGLGMLGYAAAGGLIGVSSASLIDAFALAHETKRAPAKAFQAVPAVSVTPRGGSVGVNGTF